MSFKAYIDSIVKIIEEQKIFNIKFYVIDDEIEKKIEAAVNLIFEKYSKLEWAGVIYTCAKELMINGTKANLKRILFEKNSLNLDNEDEYIEGMLEFRNALNERSYRTYLDALKTRDLWVSVRFEYDNTGFRVTVQHNAHISPIEDRRLREKLRKAMGYEDIAQFYLDQGDEIEGAGMGIALIVMLLKGLEIDPSLFRIGNTPAKTTFARLEIPFSADFISIRERQIRNG
jgi:hypothetical protein